MKIRPSHFTHTLASISLVFALVVPFAAGPLHADEDTTRNGLLRDRIAAAKADPSTSPKLEWALRQLAAIPSARTSTAAPDVVDAFNTEGVRVIITCRESRADNIATLVESLGGEVEVQAKSRLQCIVPVTELNEIAGNADVEFVRLPFHPVAEAVTEGVELVNADEWHASGYSGTGIKIGVLDIGFNGYSSLVGTELPAPVDVWWAPSVGDEGADAHGTACAEVIHDFAPGADLYFATCATDAEWDGAIAWLIGKGVDIISCSIGWYIVGPRDATGDIGAAIDAAKAAGIFWAQAAGDYAQCHWAGPWTDTDSDEWLDFDTGPVIDYASCYAAAGDTVWVRVGWNDPWGTAPNDYDLTVYPNNLSEDPIAESWDTQNGTGNDDFPLEAVEFVAPASDTYLIAVSIDHGTDEDIEVFCSHPIDYVVPEGSISDNAASSSACSVGAVGWDSPSTLQLYSAQGPTVDSRTKPDLVGPDGVTTETFGTESFSGTSAAAPHVAGAAALVLEAYPSYDEEDILTYLRSNAVDLGDSGTDDQFGWGRVLLPEAPATDDWGDAPDPSYPTLSASNGARHAVSAGLYLGAGVDAEGNALQNATATGDDTIDGNDDEDGVTFTTALIPGESASLTVTASLAGYLDGWIDFNKDGDWADDGEKLWGSSLSLLAGDNPLGFTVPADATITTSSFARFRFSSAGGLSYDGPADDGEVEDYTVTIGSYDWGDAPDPDYPTLLSSDGARHLVDGPFLGATIDAENNGQPDSDATGDDLDGNDDDDGVSFTSDVIAGDTASVDVTSSGTALLDAWMDLNNDGDWNDTGEQVFTSESLSAGVNHLAINVPLDATAADTFARFRVSSTGGLEPTGESTTGEVEDYKVTILPPPEYDFGDAPDPTYPTLLASNGARHVIDPARYLGTAIDKEDDGQPNVSATGDDTDAGGDDEDGVAFKVPYAPGTTMTLDVTASQAGYLDAWVDFNDDGDWADAGEQVFTSQLLSAGVNGLSFNVPAEAASEDSTFARFRFSSSSAGLSYTGEAADGEVEDYELSSRQSIELALKAGWNMVSVPVIPDNTSTSAVFAGADAVYTWLPVIKSYAIPLQIEPQRGYWVAVSSDTTITIDGIPVDTWSQTITQGWNMMGSLYGQTASFSDPDDIPGGSVQSFAYTWDPTAKSYILKTTIEPGKGYWIAATQNCTLALP